MQGATYAFLAGAITVVLGAALGTFVVPSDQYGIGLGVTMLSAFATFWSADWGATRVAAVNQERRRLTALSRRTGERRLFVRVTAVVVPLFAAFFLIYALSIVASADARDVRSGASSGGFLIPWKAVPASIEWAPRAARATLPSPNCRYLRFLGSANGQVILYNNQSDVVIRVPLQHVSVSNC